MKIERCHDIVISGVGGFFPKSSNLEEFKKNLLSGEDLLESRWKPGERGVTNRIGILPNINLFDTAYFGIHRQQSTFMDPMQRLVLERTFEALIDAGVNPAEVRGRRIACYIGSTVGENDNLFYESIVSGFGVTGHSRAMLTNRVSYWLNLKGPSCSYDANWVNGMEVLRLAYESIRDGQVEAAIIGTTNLALNSELSWLYNDMGLLSPDGCTRSFDADAKGYGRSDGVVVLFIQKASDARRSYASIVNVATQFNGNRDGRILDLDVDCLADFFRDFYANCDVSPNEVHYVETYGSGQKHIDKIELEALSRVYCKDRKGALKIGSVKSNAGHSEASAALFGIAKALIALDSGVIPGNINFEKPNPEIPQLLDGRMEVVTENVDFRGDYVAVNAVGLDSYYGHALLKVNPKGKREVKDDLPRLVIASTRTEAGINELLNTIKSKPKMDPEYVKLIQDLYARPITGHLYRGYLVLDEDVKQETDFYQGSKRPVWFVYAGMGSQWVGMAQSLMQLPIFAASVRKCHDILVPKGIDLINILTDTANPNLFDNILNSFVGIAAVQIGLTDVLKAVGIVPDGIIGHSVGELGCAYGDGCMTAEQMILAAYSRGKASLDAKLIKGMMAAVGLGYNQIKKKLPDTIEVACRNGPDSSTISGPTEDMEIFVKKLQSEGIFARLVNVANIAYHSRYIKPAAPLLLEALKKVLPEAKPRSSKWISTSVPEAQWDSDLAKNSSAEYHTNNLLSSVLFEEGLHHIPKDAVLIEIAPHGLLQAILKRSVKPGCTNVPLTNRGNKNGLNFLFTALGKLYLAGLDLNLSPLFPPIEYPVSRGTAGLAELSHWEHSETWRTGIEDKLNYLVSVKDIQVTLNSEEYRDCVGNQLDEKIILPTSSYLMTIMKILGTSIAEDINSVVFENLKFKRSLVIPKIGSVPLYAMIQKGSGEFEILSGEDIVVTGKISVPAAGDKFLIDADPIEKTGDTVTLSGSDVYGEFQHRGHKYSGPFKSIKELSLTEDGSICVAQWQNKWTLLLEAMIQQHLFPDGERLQNILIPGAIQRLAFSLSELPTEKQDVEITYEYSTGIISTKGMQICGLRLKPLPVGAAPLSYCAMEFVPFNGEYKSIEPVINTAMHIALENFNDSYQTTISITELISNSDDALTENVKNVAKEYKNIDVNISSVNEAKAITISQTDPTLIVTNGNLSAELTEVVTKSTVFVLVKTDKSLLDRQELTQIARYDVNGVGYSLIRKAVQSQPTIVRPKVDTLSARDVLRTNVQWVNDLKSALAKTPSASSSVYLVATVLPSEGVRNFSDELRAVQEFARVRVLFVLDKKAPEFSPTHALYAGVFKWDLYLTVVENGSCGSYVPVPIKYKGVVSSQQFASNIVDGKTINYIAVNLLDETIINNKPPQLGNINYSGHNASGQQIMGLARLDPDSHKLVTDNVLQWVLPEKLSLEDAATLPHAYVTAYLSLVVKARLKPGETVLIHRGCSPIGMAAISIASVMGCHVFTTVATDAQRALIKKIFVGLRDRNILSSDTTSFEPYLLMATGSVGAHVILNSLPGSQLHASLRCLAEFGRFVQIGKFDTEENNTIGMNFFLKNTSFYGVVPEEVFNASAEVKQELHKLVSEGMKEYVVRPTPKRIVEEQNVEEILRDIYKRSNIGTTILKINSTIALNQFNVTKPNQFICDAKSSYLIYGGTSEQWACLVEWLVFRGARRLIVSSDSKPQTIHINRRLTLLQTYFKADIIFAPCKAQTRESAAELLAEIGQLGAVHVVFMLPGAGRVGGAKVAAECKSVQYLEGAVRAGAPKAVLVNFVAAASGVCQQRSGGPTTYNIQWEKSLEFDDVVKGLDDILSYPLPSILIKNDRIIDTEQESSQAIFKRLQLLLPPSIDDFKKEVKTAPNKPELTQLPTLGPRYIREVPPLFIVPGLQGKRIVKDLANQLLYPTFCATLPGVPTPLASTALELAREFVRVYPRGPYNIVALSLGGALAVEIAKNLEKDGHNTLVYFVDAAPDTIQSALRITGEGIAREVYLITKLLNINDSETVKRLNSLPDWEARVKYGLKNYPEAAGDEELLEKALNVLRDRVEQVARYEPTEPLVAGKIHLLRPVGASKYDNCGLLKYCKQTAPIHIIPGDHVSIVKHPLAAEIINEKVTVRDGNRNEPIPIPKNRENV